MTKKDEKVVPAATSDKKPKVVPVETTIPEGATVPEETIAKVPGQAGPNEDGKVDGAVAASTGAAPTDEDDK